MELYVLRHAIAEPLTDWLSGKDSERALTAEGKQKMRNIAKGMKALDLSFDRILSSPFRRAKQTAEIVAEIFHLNKALEVLPALAAGTKTKQLVQALHKYEGSAQSLIVVGHEPDLSSLIATLTSGHTQQDIALKKGGLCKLTVESLHCGRCARLEWLLTPNQLALIG